MNTSIGTPIFNVNRNTDHAQPDNIGMSIGTRIKEARKLRGMSQRDLASKTGVSQPTLSELETGESAGTTYLARIATVLRVHALWLETGKGPRDSDATVKPPGERVATSFLDLRAETAAELRLLSVYRLANEREREAIDDIVEQMSILIERRTRKGS